MMLKLLGSGRWPAACCVSFALLVGAVPARAQTGHFNGTTSAGVPIQLEFIAAVDGQPALLWFYPAYVWVACLRGSTRPVGAAVLAHFETLGSGTTFQFLDRDQRLVGQLQMSPDGTRLQGEFVYADALFRNVEVSVEKVSACSSAPTRFEAELQAVPDPVRVD